MLDDLRNSASSSYEEEPSPQGAPEHRQRRRVQGEFMGMTAVQRFVIALLLFLMTCVLASFCLVITEKMVLPFF